MEYTLAVRISAIFVTFSVSVLGFAIPLHIFAKKETDNNNDSSDTPESSLQDDWIRILRSFAAGTMLAVGIIHLLSDGLKSLSAMNIYPPLGYTVATFGTLLVLGIEEIATAIIKTYFPEVVASSSGADERKCTSAACALESGADGGGGGLQLEELTVVGNGHNDGELSLRQGEDCVHSHFHKIDLINNMDVRSNLLKAYMLEFAVAIHSVLLGVSLGSLSGPANEGALRALYIAICFHQFAEGFSLGAVVKSVQLSMVKVIIFVVTFGFAVSIGTVIGILITDVSRASTDDESNPEKAFTTGIINCLCAGIMVYVSLVELVAEDFQSSKIANRFGLKAKMYTSLLLGASGMAILAIWA